jgi:hypothetical protein
MREDREEALLRLQAELDERALLLREMEGVQAEMEGGIEPERVEEILKRLSRLSKLEEQSHVTFVKYCLMLTLSQAEEAKRTKEEQFKKGSYDQEYMELHILEQSLEGVLGMLDEHAFPKSLISLSILLIEIGRRLPLLGTLTGEESLRLTDLLPYSTDAGIQSLLHAHKCGYGGKLKAANEREKKMEILAPLFAALKRERFNGRYRSLRSAVEGLLDRDELCHIHDHIPPDGQKYPLIAYDTFLYPEAKKIWNAEVRVNKSK